MSLELRLFRWVFLFDFGGSDLFIKLCSYELHIVLSKGVFAWSPDFERTQSGFYGNWLKLNFVGSHIRP